MFSLFCSCRNFKHYFCLVSGKKIIFHAMFITTSKHYTAFGCTPCISLQKDVPFLFIGTLESIALAKMMLTYHLSHLKVFFCTIFQSCTMRMCQIALVIIEVRVCPHSE